MPQLGLGNGYSIDLDDGWIFVRILETARDQLGDLWRRHGADLRVSPPGGDGHSGFFSTEMNQKLDAHQQWYENQRSWLNEMINHATGILNQYGVAEAENTMTWAGVSTSTDGTRHAV